MKMMKLKISNCKGKASFVDTSRGLRSVGVKAPFLKPCPRALFTCFQKFCLVFFALQNQKSQTSTGDIRKCSVYSIKDITQRRLPPVSTTEYRSPPP